MWNRTGARCRRGRKHPRRRPPTRRPVGRNHWRRPVYVGCPAEGHLKGVRPGRTKSGVTGPTPQNHDGVPSTVSSLHRSWQPSWGSQGRVAVLLVGKWRMEANHQPESDRCRDLPIVRPKWRHMRANMKLKMTWYFSGLSLALFIHFKTRNNIFKISHLNFNINFKRNDQYSIVA